MGSYEREMQQVAAGTAERGATALEYFEELDKLLVEEASMKSHRPNYKRTLFNPEHDDVYREFCAFVDQPVPRSFTAVENPISVMGLTAADVYDKMIHSNGRILDIDGAAVYNMLVKLRTQPEVTMKVLGFKPTCYQGGCGAYDGAHAKGLHEWQKEQSPCGC